jgi:hypothetical protein
MAGAETIRGAAAYGGAEGRGESLASNVPLRRGLASRNRGFPRSGAGSGKRSIALRRAHGGRNNALARSCGPDGSFYAAHL